MNKFKNLLVGGISFSPVSITKTTLWISQIFHINPASATFINTNKLLSYVIFLDIKIRVLIFSKTLDVIFLQQKASIFPFLTDYLFQYKSNMVPFWNRYIFVVDRPSYIKGFSLSKPGCEGAQRTFTEKLGLRRKFQALTYAILSSWY